MRLAVCCVLFLACPVTYGQTGVLPTAPTLPEIVRMLQANLVGTSHTQQHSETMFDLSTKPPRETGHALASMEQTIRSVSIADCTLTIVIDSKAEGVPASVLEFDVPLEKTRLVRWNELELTPQSTAEKRVIEIPDRISRVVVQTTGPFISQKIRMLRDDSSSVDMVDTFNILLDEKQRGPAVVRGLRDSARVCHAESQLDAF